MVVYPVFIVFPPDTSVVQSPVIVFPVSPTDFIVKDIEELDIVVEAVFDGELVPTLLMADAL